MDSQVKQHSSLLLLLQGLNQAQKRAMYIRSFGQLMWWCLLMAVMCTAFLLLLMATPTWVDPTFGLGKVPHTAYCITSWTNTLLSHSTPPCKPGPIALLQKVQTVSASVAIGWRHSDSNDRSMLKQYVWSLCFSMRLCLHVARLLHSSQWLVPHGPTSRAGKPLSFFNNNNNYYYFYYHY